MLVARVLFGRVVSLLVFALSGTRASAVREASSARSESTSETADEVDLEALKTRLGAGDTDAFERIFRCLSESVFRFVCGMVQDEARAHDITQDTFATLWTIRDRMDEVDSLRAYVFQMARNQVYNQQRDEKTRREYDEDLRDFHEASSPPSPAQNTDAAMLQATLEEWIDELPDRQQEALCLRRQENLSHQEIAEIMGISPSTVNNHIVRAMKHLRSRLQKHRPGLLS
jgi:RNA polymerase sigma-70 factor (ECF subfamily)